MPAGDLTLLEGQAYGDNMVKKGVIETLVSESPVLEYLPFLPIAGNALEVSVEDTLPSPAYRNVNEGYTTSKGTDTKRFFGVSILGGEVFIDNFILKVQANKVGVKARQYAKFAKAMSRTFDKSFIDGTGTAKDFMGLNALIDSGLGQILDANDVTLKLDILDQAFDLMRTSSPDVILMNRTERRRITGLARSTYSGISLIDIGNDSFGRKVTQYNGVPIRISGDDITGTALLAYDETYGGDSSTTSVYLLKFGTEENVCGLSGAGGSMDVQDFGETEAAPGHLGRVEWYPGLAIYDTFSAVRIAALDADAD